MFNSFGQYENEFQQWVRGGYPGVKDETFAYIQHLSDPQDDAKPREGTLWPHQWDSFLRVIYAYEIEPDALAQPDGVLLNVVTGGGKTAIIAALIAWLRLAHDVHRFVMLCPNLIVRDRLEEDFENGKVFADRDLIPQDSIVKSGDFALATLGSDRDRGWAGLLGASVILGNIHQFYTSSATGKTNVAELMNGGDFALFNDEAHNAPAPEWDRTLETLRPKTRLRVDTTATPDRADGKTPDSSMIYEYSIQDALADRLVKQPVVYQPNIETVELTYTDALTGETRSVEEVDWDEVDRLGIRATQWVTDDKPMQQQMGIALQRLEEQERRAKGRYQPILFVVAVCKIDAQQARKTLQEHFGIKTLLVTEDSDIDERRQATQLGDAMRGGNPYKAVVSVLMLREGWDVPEVGVILLLRKFGSPVYGQQVIGRGLRRVRQHGVGADERQICSVIDHPKLEHQWLWDIFSSKVRTDVGIDDMFDEEEDLPEPPPRQEVDAPENFIEIPESLEEIEDGEFEVDVPDESDIPEPIEDWEDVLNDMVYDEPDMEWIEITDQDISGVEQRELIAEGWRTLQSAPENMGEAGISLDSDELADAIQDELMAMSERLLDGAGFTTQFKGKIYGILLNHVKGKFLDGASLGLAGEDELKKVTLNLPQIEKNFGNRRGLVEGMVKHGDK